MVDQLALPPELADGGAVGRVRARRAADRRKNCLLVTLAVSFAVAAGGPIVIGTSTGVRGGEGSGEAAPIVAGIAMLVVGVVATCLSLVKIRAESNRM
jgi:hypothetical protein